MATTPLIAHSPITFPLNTHKFGKLRPPAFTRKTLCVPHADHATNRRKITPEINTKSSFIKIQDHGTYTARNVAAKSVSSQGGTASTLSETVMKVTHLVVSLGILLAVDKMVKKVLADAALKFPSAIFGMLSIFCVLMILDSTAPDAATTVTNFFKPALHFIQRWLPLFYIPALVAFPASAHHIPAASFIKICYIIVGGWLASLCVGGYTAVTLRNAVKTPLLPAEKVAEAAPFTMREVYIWSGIFLASFVSALYNPTLIGTHARTCLPFLLASSVLGYMGGFWLPATLRRILHPVVCCALSTELAVYVFCILSKTNFHHALGHYLTKTSSNPGAGDVLTGFLGAVVLSYAFSLFAQRKIIKRHATEIFASITIVTVFSLYATAYAGRWLGLAPSLTIAILPKCITVAFALQIASMFEGANPSLTAAAVVVTGIIGANFVKAVLNQLKLRDPLARGVATASSEGLDSGPESTQEPESLPYYAISHGLTGIVGALICSVPVVRHSLLTIIG